MPFVFGANDIKAKDIAGGRSCFTAISFQEPGLCFIWRMFQTAFG